MSLTAMLLICCRGISSKEIWYGIIVSFVYTLVYYHDRYVFLLYIAVIIIGLTGVEYHRILKMYLFTIGLFFVITILAGITESITNFIYVRTERGIRSSWGICYPTDLATYYLYILLYLWVVWKKLPDWIILILSISSMVLSGSVAYSSTSFICSILFAGLIIYHAFERNNRVKWSHQFFVFRAVDIFLTVSFPFFAACFFFLMMLYAKGIDIGYKLNVFLSNRLRYAVEAFHKYGLKPFGTPFEQIGAGFSSIIPSDYNFVDSSYPLILIRYGVVLFAVICILWCLMIRKAIISGDRRLALIMGLFAFHSFSEHHFIEPTCNILLLMPFSTYTFSGSEESESIDSKKALVLAPVAASTTIAFLYIFSPHILSWMKTFYEIKNLVGGKECASWVITGNLLFLLILSGIVWSLYRVLKVWGTERKILKKYLLMLLFCLCTSLVCCLYVRNTIRSGVSQREKSIKVESKLIQLMLESATGKVYAGTIPSVYKAYFPNISYSFFSGAELARHYGSTVIMDSDTEYQSFLKSGFLYTSISDEHSVYTSDKEVIRALTHAGFHLTSYYSAAKYVDIRNEARRNGLTFSKTEGALVTGSERSLLYGPYLDLYDGQYTVTFHLAVPEENWDKDSYIASLQVWTNWGKEKLLEKDVFLSAFGENRIASISVPFSVGSVRGVEISVLAAQGQRLYVRGIDYKRTPEYDTHSFYDKKMRLVREEYFDTDGNPMAHAGGYYSMDQNYDSAGNVAERYFYDADGKLTLRTDGYASVKWKYDARRRVIREEFYGLLGEPVLMSGRYAADEREYDEDGNVSVLRYRDTNDEPIVSTGGYAEIHRKYNEKKKVTFEEYFGTDGNPMLQTSGYSAMEQDYDADGNVSRRSFLHEGKPVLRTDGYAEVRWEHNGLHQVVREAFFGAEGEPVVLEAGYSVNEREYDTAGNITVYRYYDGQGNPAQVSGYSELHRAYDDRRQILREEYFGPDGQPVLRAEGYASWKREYTEEGIGTVRAQSYYGVSGEPVIMSEGYHSFRREFDENGNMISESYFDTEGKPVLCKKGYASFRRTYDANSNISEDVFLNAEGGSAVLGAGYSSIRYEYDENRQLLLTYYLDKDGNPIQAGSAYLHEYFQSLKGKNITVFISAKDEAASALTPPLLQDLKGLGIKTDLQGRVRSSFYAVISPGSVVEEIGSQTVLSHEGMVGDVPYTISSAGYQVGNTSSIVIDGVEYSKNRRGLNVVVYDNSLKQVTDAVCFDTYLQEMTVTR